MSNSDTTGRGFAYTGTAETLYDLKILADYCNTLLPCQKHDIDQLYTRNFSYGLSFTFVGSAEDAFATQMTWVEEGEDDTGTFQIYRPEGSLNPYTRCKTSRVIRGGRMFDIHVYYRNLNIRMDFPMLVQILVKLDLPCIVRELLLLRLKVHTLLSELYESNFMGDTVVNLQQCQRQALTRLMHEREFSRDDTTLLDQLKTAYELFASIDFLKDICGDAPTENLKQVIRDLVYTVRDENVIDTDRLYCEWAQ